MNDYLHFYGTDNPELFAIERAAMDRQGKVIQYLDEVLPSGRIVDVGAGNGFTAAKLLTGRTLTCVEPSPTMPNFDLPVTWVRATAETMPFHEGYFNAAYSTWAYFLSGVDKTKGLEAVTRCIRHDGLLVIVDNAGDDEFTSYAGTDIVSDSDWYLSQGFDQHIIETAFEFETLADAEQLMTAFFGAEAMQDNIRLTYPYRVAAYKKTISRSS